MSTENSKTRNIILFIDDQLLSHTLIDLMVLDSGKYEFVHAYTAKEGLELAEKHASDICLVMCDVMLPDIRGYDVCDIFQKDPKLSNIPFVFQSGLPMQKTGLQNTSVPILYKPYNQSDVAKIISELLI